MRSVTLFPFACLFWAGAVFVFAAGLNVVLLHRDVGIGDGFDCPLPNGYALSFIDTTEAGTVYNPKGRSLWSDVRENALNDVTAMQLAGPYILGGVDSERFEHFGQDLATANSWFLLDTSTGERMDFKTLAEPKESARRINVTVTLIPVGNLYSKYRFTWFDALAGALLVVPPLTASVLLVRWTLRLRKIRETD